jgi:hypothetical protein
MQGGLVDTPHVLEHTTFGANRNENVSDPAPSLWLAFLHACAVMRAQDRHLAIISALQPQPAEGQALTSAITGNARATSRLSASPVVALAGAGAAAERGER